MRVDDYESDEEDGVNSEECRNEMDDWSFGDDGDSINVNEFTDGLSAWDELGEEFECEAVENGKLFILVQMYTL